MVMRLAGLRSLAATAALLAIGCEAPDRSALYEPPPAVLRTEAPNDEMPDDAAPNDGAPAAAPTKDASDDLPAGVETPNDEGAPPAGGIPVSTDGDTTPLDPPTPGAPPPDAGLPNEPVEPVEPVAPDAGSEPPPPPPEPACAGDLVDDVCWYLGEVDQSCNTVCATHGGFAPASASHIGTPAQGGSVEACAAILEALGVPPAGLLEGFRNDGLGFGCHLFVDVSGAASAWWLAAPAFSPAVAAPSVRLVCGCAS